MYYSYIDMANYGIWIFYINYHTTTLLLFLTQLDVEKPTKTADHFGRETIGKLHIFLDQFTLGLWRNNGKIILRLDECPSN
jgi:hypothetical protein